MPPKTLTAEQVAEIDRQQKPAVNMRNIVPQREDVLAARITAQQRREAAPATLTPEQADATEAQTSVSAMTPFGRAMGAEPDKTAGPVFQPKKRLSATEVDQMQYEQISDPAYMPTKDEFQWYEGYKKTRNDKVSKFVQGAKGMAGGLVQAAAATAYAPFDLIVRGTNAYDEWVNSSAEGLRQTSIGLAELWSWGGDIYEDNQKELQRSRDLNNQIRQQLAAENKFTGNAQQDEQTLQQAIEQAKAGGMYEKTADDQNADEDARYERFIRDRSFQQQAANITETNIGTLPDSQREMGIDPSKVNPGLAFTAQLVFDPLNAVVPGGIGALSNLRLMRRAAALTGTPLKGLSKVAKAGADKVEDIYGGILSGIESRTGLNEAAVMGALNNPVTWRAVAAMGILKGTGKVLRKSENWLETGSIIAKEAGVGGVGLSRADAAAKLRNAPIPGRYRRAYDGFFTSADSTLRRVSETPGLSPIARRSAATLDRTGVTQAFRLADDAVSGAAAAAPIGIPFAAIAPEDRQPEILGAILSIGAAGGVVGGQVRRMSEMNDALVAKMLADAEISGGDAVAMANMLSPEKLSDMARKQTMISAKADWVPLRAADYELNKTVQAAVGNGTKGIHVEVTAGKRPRVFLNLDKLASGDVAGHEIGHAIFMSDIMGGEIKQGMRAMVDVEYGAEGLAARGREYAAAMLTQEVNQGATGIKLEVLTPEEVNRKAAGVSEADLIRDRWSNDSAWRESAINERIDLMDQERMAKGGQQLDWARDEIAAETFSGLGKGVNLSGLRASGPLGRAVGAAQTALDMMGARFRGNGRLESPNQLFTENPLFDSPQMRKAVNDYVKIYDRYLVGLEKEGKVKQRGTPIAPTGRASDAARSPHTRLYPNKGVVESDLFVQRPDGTLELKSQQMINTQDKARAATLKSINLRDRLVPENSQEWGARRLSNGRVAVGGPTLPPQFDFFLQMPEWLRFKAREFEAGRNEGRSYLYSYNAIGTGADGSYKVKNLGNVEAKTGEAVPFGWDLSQKNHLLAKVIDLNSFRASSMRAIDNQLLGEFGNDLKAVEAGLKQLLKNYQDGVPGETNLGVTKKNILNGLLGTGTPTQRANNPAWHTLNNQGSIRTFRFDRLNYADPYGTGYFPHYDKLNINALPDNAGRMSLDEYMVFDADRQTAWLNNRARERGHSNSTNWANSDEAGFAAASEEYRKLFPRPDNNNRMPQQIPREAQGMPDVAPRGQAMADVGGVDADSVGLRSAKFLEEAVGDGMENLRAKQAKREGTGVAKNKFVRFHDNQGRPIYIGAIKKDGGKSFAGWIEETEAWQVPAETTAYRQWYRELKGYFTEIFGGRAGEMMMAWLAAQQNVSPGGALGNVFKVEDRLAGIGTGKKGGLADAKIEGVLRGEVPEGGFGPKLTDFVDAGFLREYRTYMAKQPAGGRPFVADVHTGRDSGHVDQQTLTRLKQRSDDGDLFIDGKPTRVKVLDTKTVKQGNKTVIVPERIRVIPQGSKGFDVGVDMRGSPGGPKYEGISEWGNAMTDHLNKIGWRGGEWTPAEVQAVGWMRVLRQYGLPEPTVLSALQQNTSRIYAEVNFSSGNLLPANYPSFDLLSPEAAGAITMDVIPQAIGELAQMIGGSLRVQRVSSGTGVWGKMRSPTTVIEVLGSAEATDILGLALANSSEQAMTMSAVLGVGGKDSRVLMFKKADGSKFNDVEMQSIIDDAEISGYTMEQLPGGDAGMIADATKDFKPKGLTEKRADQAVKRLNDWAGRNGIKIDVEDTSARVQSYGNDWKSNQDGQSYLSAIVKRGGASKIRDIVRFRGRYAEILREAYKRHAPELVLPEPQEQIAPIRQAAESPPLEILEMLRGA
jgi:hypothetical protein